MRARLRYSMVSPRGPQRFAGFVTGLVFLIAAVLGVLALGIVGPMVTHTAAAALVAVAGL